MVLDVLTRFKQSEVEKAIGQLDTDEIDVLMKYIYRGFAEPTEKSCGILLVWHQHVRYHSYCSTFILSQHFAIYV